MNPVYKSKENLGTSEFEQLDVDGLLILILMILNSYQKSNNNSKQLITTWIRELDNPQTNRFESKKSNVLTNNDSFDIERRTIHDRVQ